MARYLDIAPLPFFHDYGWSIDYGYTSDMMLRVPIPRPSGNPCRDCGLSWEQHRCEDIAHDYEPLMEELMVKGVWRPEYAERTRMNAEELARALAARFLEREQL